MVLLTAGVAVGGWIGWFYLRSDTGGSRLLHAEQHAVASARRHPKAAAAACGSTPAASATAAAPGATGAPEGIVEARSIGMTAPVVAGDGDGQLADAVGHVTASVWPGQPGTAILVAHDVTYFSDIDSLGTGTVVRYVTPCATYSYRVTGHEIVTAGSPLYSDPVSSILVLETCYPTDALYFTDQRYLVTATLASTSSVGGSVPRAAAIPASPTVPAPAALTQQGLTLTANDAPMGVLTIDGSPSTSWSQSAAPYGDESAALAEYFGALRSALQADATWWSDLAPAVPLADARPLATADVSGYATPIDVTLDVDGSSLTGVTLSAAVIVTGGAAPGTYSLHVTIADEAGTLHLTGWSMAAAG